MRLLIKDRGKGKTTGLIYTSEATGYPIVAKCTKDVEYIKYLALELGCRIPEPMTVDELRRGGYCLEKVLVDEVQIYLDDALKQFFGCEVCCATLTDIIKEREELMRRLALAYSR